ncbi:MULTISPECIES: hemolysin XhlA family protein [Cytobacillus]|uniref:hemolysin XhlA family protein n=1 Tax=Cytobacillus TaxID=2675230 RepID=UPI002559C6C3|nr:hemolysin XhlA family protein [Cytobacillus kochii]
MEAVEVNTHDKDITQMKQDIKLLEKDVADLKNKTSVHEEQIKAINKTLDSINDNTTWIKRALIGAIITAVCTGLIGGAIALFYNVIGG